MTIDSEGTSIGVIPVTLLAKVLSDVQSAFHQIGDYHYRGSSIRETGAFPAEVTRGCQLWVLGTSSGSFKANLAVAPSEDLFNDLGLQTKNTFLALLQASTTPEFSARANELIADPAARSQVLRSLRPSAHDQKTAIVSKWRPRVIFPWFLTDAFGTVLNRPYPSQARGNAWPSDGW